MTKNDYDVIIVGGGIMGSASAYYLAREDSSLNLAVVERDPAYTRASTTQRYSHLRKEHLKNAASKLESVCHVFITSDDTTAATD